jgi:hypothetical protein
MIAEQLEQAIAPAGEVGTMADRLRRFVALEHRRRELEELLEDVKGRADGLAQLLLDDFADCGMQRTTVDGLTVHIRTDRYVSKRKGIETEAVCRMLEAVGREDMVADGYNASSLKAWVLEQLAQKRELETEINKLRERGESVPDGMEAQLAEVDKIKPLLDLLSVGETPRIISVKA